MSVTKFIKAAQEIQSKAHHRKIEEAPRKPADDEGNWLVSYADMMTLLCGFFIMLFSMAKMDEPKYEVVKEAMSKQFGGSYTSPNKELANSMATVLKDAKIEDIAEIQQDHLGISIIIESTLFFDTLSSELRTEGRESLDKIIQALAERQRQEKKQFVVVVEGHTDSRPILGGTFPSNWELSGARASRVIRMFLNEKFAPEKLTAIGYGDTRPLHPSRLANGAWDEKALAKNRRVVLRILNPGAEAIPLPPPPKEPQPEETATAAATAPEPRHTEVPAAAPAPMAQGGAMRAPAAGDKAGEGTVPAASPAGAAPTAGGKAGTAASPAASPAGSPGAAAPVASGASAGRGPGAVNAGAAVGAGNAASAAAAAGQTAASAQAAPASTALDAKAAAVKNLNAGARAPQGAAATNAKAGAKTQAPGAKPARGAPKR